VSDLERFGVSMGAKLLRAFDERIAQAGYTSRSEALRDVVRDYLVASEWEAGAGDVVGTVTIVYDHQTRELEQALTEVQHDYHDLVLCSTHVHLDAHHCLEVIIVRGTPAQVHALGERLISARGVKHGKIVCTTSGRALA